MFELLAVATFFALLGLPGYALLRRLHRPLLGEGVLAAIGPSYLATFAVLTPVSVLGYALRWPIAVLAGAYVVAVVGASIALWPALRAALEARTLPKPGWPAAVVGLLIVADLILAARTGGHALDDGHYHVGRVRSLLDHGFQSWDPRSAVRGFDAAYHTNLYHALLAVASKLTGAAAFEVWAYALPWTKLISAASIYRFALVAVGRPAAALAAVACAVLWSLARTTFVYPNMLAPYALVPLALSFGLELGSRDTRVRGALGLGLGALAIVQVHTLYYAFLCLALGPCLLVVLGAIERDVRALALAMVLLVGTPWALQSARHRGSGGRAVAAAVAAEAEAAAAAAGQAETEREPAAASDADEDAGEPERVSSRVQRSFERREHDRNRGFSPAGGGQIALDASALWDPTSTRFQLLFALGVGLLLTRRRELAMVAGVVLTLLLALHVPWLCTELVRLAGAPWIVRRLSGVLEGLAIGTVPAVLGYVIAGASSALPRVALALIAGLGYGQLQGVDSRAWTRKDVVADAISGTPLRRRLGSQRRRSLLLQDVPSGAVLVTSLGRAPEIAGICDCYPLAFLPEHGSHGMKDMPQRRMAVRQILAPNTPLAERLALMRRYATRHIHLGRTTKARKLQKALGPALIDTKRSQAGLLLTVDTALHTPLDTALHTPLDTALHTPLDTPEGAHLRSRATQTR